MGNPRKSQPSEIDASLSSAECGTGHLRRPRLPKIQRYANLTWLALIPLGDSVIEGPLWWR